MPPPELNLRRFKGLRLYYPKSEKSQDELSQADNIMFDREGVLVARPGIKHQTALVSADSSLATASPGHLLVAFPHASFSTVYLFLSKSNRMFVSDGVSPFTEVPGGSNTGTAYEAVIYDDKVWLSTGLYYDLATMSAVSGMPTGREVILVHKDRLWITSRSTTLGSTNPYRIYFSEPGAPLSGGWPAANFIDVRTSTPNRGLVSYRDSIYVFKPNSVWVLNTGGLPSNWSLRQLGNQGSIGGYCVYNNVLYWVGETGVYSYNGVEITRLSDPIQSYFDGSRFTYDNFCQVVGFEGNLIIAVAKQGQPRDYWIYNIRLRAWSKMVTPLFSTLGRMLVVDTKFAVIVDNVMPGVYFGGGENAALAATRKARVWRMDPTVFKDTDYLDGDQPYSVTFETEQFDFDSPLDKKRVHQVSIEASFTDLTIDQIDEEGRTKTKALVGEDPTKVTQVRIPALGYFRRMRFKFSTVNFPGGLKFYGLRAILKERGQESDKSVGTYANQP